MFRFFPYWPLFAVLSIVMLISAWVYLKFASPVYEITATLLIKDEKKGVEDPRMMESLNMYTSKKIVENEIEVIRSKTLIRETVKRLQLCSPVFEEDLFSDRSAYTSSPVSVQVRDLDSLREGKKVYFFYDRVNHSVQMEGKDYPLNEWTSSYYGDIRFVKNPFLKEEGIGQFYVSFLDPRAVVNGLSASLNVLASNKLTTVITLSLKDPVPVRGENILNTLIDSYGKAAINDKNSFANNTLAFVEERIKLVVHDLDSLEKSIQRYKSSRGIVDLSEQGKVFLKNVGDNDQKLSELNMQLAVLDKVEGYIVRKDTTSRIVPSTLGIRDEGISLVIQKLYDAELDYSRQRRTTTKNNPLLIALHDEIQNMQSRILENVRNQKLSLMASRTNLTSTNSKYATVLGSLPQQERELLEATRQQSIKSDVYTFLLQKREEMALSQESNMSDSRLVDRAEASIYPVSPKKLFTYVGALAFAFGLAISWVAWKEMLGDKILFRSEIESSTDIPIAAEISDSQSRDYIVVDSLKKPMLAEQFMQMRAAVGLYGNNSMKVVMVTSSITGEGKTFVSTNFAVSLAGSSKKVLLVDLDFRNPRLSNLFQATNHAGAADVLQDNIPVQKVIHSTMTQNLFFMSAGKKRMGATSTLMDGNLENMFKELRARFDYIIVDTPPISPVIDAFVASKFCDATLFVMRHGTTPKKAVELMKEHSKVASLKNISIVFNGVKPRGLIKSDYGYGYASGYEFGYTSGTKPARKFLGNFNV